LKAQFAPEAIGLLPLQFDSLVCFLLRPPIRFRLPAKSLPFSPDARLIGAAAYRYPDLKTHEQGDDHGDDVPDDAPGHATVSFSDHRRSLPMAVVTHPEGSRILPPPL